MSTGTIREQILSAVQQHLGKDANESGSVLYNGSSTLRPGKLYLLGLNPGGDPSEIKQSVNESVKATFDKLRSDYCAYEDECWKQNHPVDCMLKECKGESPHQRRVSDLVDALGLGVIIKDVFAANAIFLRTKDQLSLKMPWKLWENCWHVHKLFLSIVQPKLILCLGNGNGLSAFSLLRSRFLGAPTPQNVGPNGFRDGKWFAGRVAVCQEPCTVVGIPHPSRFGMSEKLEHYLKELGDKLTA